MSTQAPAAQTKTCTTCGTTRALDQFNASRRSGDGLYSRCRPCRAVARRRGPSGDQLPRPGDPVVAIRLREELADARATGQTFETAWPTAVTAALDTSRSPKERESWERAIASTRGAWEAGYDRTDAGHGSLAMLAAAA